MHDPTIIREGHQYYVFSTGQTNGPVANSGNIQIRRSSNLSDWEYIGTVFTEIPGWIEDQIGEIRNIWAPDIIYINGLYHLYYSGSHFGRNESVIGLATNRALDPESANYKWNDQGLVLKSTSADAWNAIDPNPVLDHAGELWLAFGSFWTGIKLIHLDKRTGKPDGHEIISLARRPEPPNAIEAPCIVYREPYYYLFVSFDFCCRGVNSTYKIMVGRAPHINGPYVDKAGKPMLEGGGTQLLSNAGHMIGAGGQTVYKDGERYLIAHHYYDATDHGRPKLQVRELKWTADGWPALGEPLVRA